MTALADADCSFALCLTHDVDRPYKTPFHAAYYALADRDPRHLRALAEDVNPYWQFETVTALEDDLGVRSAWYFLSEPPLWRRSLREALSFDALVQEFGRYDVRDPPIADAMADLADGGWEVGLHGSYHAGSDRERLRTERDRIETVLDGPVRGGRQHYLNHDGARTWIHYQALGLEYDASLGSSTDAGFEHGYGVRRPFDDDFVVFPLTLMEQHLPDPGEDFDAAWAVCEDLLAEAADNDAVMTTLFHPRFFSERDFPGYRRLYERLIREANARGAWVGAPGECYDEFLAPPTGSQDAPARSEEPASKSTSTATD
ncbi:MAG: polysaccharide deacetylase family protein [Haloarculaceae archaeon]